MTKVDEVVKLANGYVVKYWDGKHFIQEYRPDFKATVQLIGALLDGQEG